MIKYIVSAAAGLIVGAIAANQFNRANGQQGKSSSSNADSARYTPDEADEDDSEYIQKKMAEYRRLFVVKNK
uniref:hypothetical protein n=1 Tax=Roseivirga sp. TaxID=1964215 RepID=UPI004047AD80